MLSVKESGHQRLTPFIDGIIESGAHKHSANLSEMMLSWHEANCGLRPDIIEGYKSTYTILNGFLKEAAEVGKGGEE